MLVVYMMVQLNTGKFYIGSTCDLKARIIAHKNAARKNTAMRLYETFDAEKVVYITLEEVTTENRFERETVHILTNLKHPLCLNKNRPKISKEQYIEKIREWQETHKEQNYANIRRWQHENKDRYDTIVKNWQQKNKDKMRAYQKSFIEKRDYADAKKEFTRLSKIRV